MIITETEPMIITGIFKFKILLAIREFLRMNWEKYSDVRIFYFSNFWLLNFNIKFRDLGTLKFQNFFH